MNKLLSLLGLLLLSSPSHLYSQQIDTITFVDNFTTGDSTPISLPLKAKPLRKSSKGGGKIELIYTATEPIMQDTLGDAIMYAVHLWEDYLPANTSVKIRIQSASIADDAEYEVMYSARNDTIYPLSYFRNNITNQVTQDFDATLIFSSSVNWCCNYTYFDGSNIRNLTTAMMRGIAIALGFGTSVRKKGNNIVFDTSEKSNIYTPFEYLVYNDSTHQSLSSIIRGNRKRDNIPLRTFSQPENGNLKVRLGNTSYNLYAPSTFDANKSMIFLSESDCLMHYEMPTGSSCLRIDDITLEILTAIGWPLAGMAPPPPIDIYCEGIPESGIASIYNSYTFKIRNYNSNISNSKWKFLIRNADREFDCISQQANVDTFRITPPSPQGLTVNADGDVEAVVRYIYTLNGQTDSVSYSLSLECSPKILGISNQVMHFEENSSLFDYSFNVKYVGATSVTIGIEEEYSSLYRHRYFSEPYLAHVYLTEMSRGNYVWIDVSVTNTYGTDLQTIEIPDQSPGTNGINHIACRQEATIKSISVDHINIYSTDGRFLGTVKQLQALQSYGNKPLILHYFDHQGQLIRTRKTYSK